MGTLKNLNRLLLRCLNFFEEYSLIAAYVLIPVLIVIEVFSRYLMKSAVIGIEEGCLMIVAYAYYIGAAYALKKKDHITVKVLHLLPIPQKLSYLIKCFAAFLSLVCATAITWYIVKYFLFVSKSPSLYTPFSFRKFYYLAGPAIGWVLVFIYSMSDFINAANRYYIMERK